MRRSYSLLNQAAIGINFAALAIVGLNGCGEPSPVTDLSPATLGGLVPTAKNGGVQVYLLRGLDDIFSTGLNSLSSEMNGHGIPALSLSGPTWPSLAAAIEDSYSSGTWRGDLVLVGHSYGCDDAVQLATELDSKAIPVRLMLLLDATNPAPIPDNIDRCVHYYLPTIFSKLDPAVFPGNAVQAAPGNNHTDIVNEVVSQENFGPGVQGVEHFNIDSSDTMHQAIIQEVLKLTPSPPR